ncbi:MAG TPA: hypothetical protein VFI39_09455 [Gemmatimonadales bacterium]|nr:hypothetical protein [Gemmatimonadales bacterium]
MSLLLGGCAREPIVPAAGSDNSWQLITTYTVPAGQWHPSSGSTQVRLRGGTAAHPNVTISAFPLPQSEMVAVVSDSILHCRPEAACRLVDSNRVHIGQADTILWYAENHGPAVSYDLDVKVNALGSEPDTSIAHPWRAGEQFEVEVNAAANSYRVVGLVDGKRVGFWVKDSVDDSSKKLVTFIRRTDIPGIGPVAQRNYLYRLAK